YLSWADAIIEAGFTPARWTWTKEKFLDELRKAIQELKTTSSKKIKKSPKFRRVYKAFIRHGEEWGYSSWADAIIEAGFQPVGADREEKFLRDIGEAFRELGTTSSSKILDSIKFRKHHATFTRHKKEWNLPRWSDAVIKAGFTPARRTWTKEEFFRWSIKAFIELGTTSSSEIQDSLKFRRVYMAFARRKEKWGYSGWEDALFKIAEDIFKRIKELVKEGRENEAKEYITVLALYIKTRSGNPEERLKLKVSYGLDGQGYITGIDLGSSPEIIKIEIAGLTIKAPIGIAFKKMTLHQQGLPLTNPGSTTPGLGPGTYNPDDLPGVAEFTDPKGRKANFFADPTPLDTRPIEYGLRSAHYVKYDMAIKEIANPHNEDKIALSGGAGHDWASLILSTNATEVYFVDQTPLYIQKLEWLLGFWDKLKEDRLIRDYIELEKYWNHGVIKVEKDWNHRKGVAVMKDIEYKLLIHLQAMGVKKEDIELIKNLDGTVTIKFKWQYTGQRAKVYSITYIQADITKPNKYPQRLKEVLRKGIDIYYQKAGRRIPEFYSKF
ncbi:MAG: hypothetical protein Q8N61_01670, partial [bacterium]|nr:hypothetical protein [bacterium]